MEDSLPDSSLLSAVEFDRSGEFLATGDRGGRVVVLRCDDSKAAGKLHYKFHCEFQSHEAEFDYVKSVAIEEKINKIKWLPATNGHEFMLTTNDRAVKLWKLAEKEVKFATGFNLTNEKGQKPGKKIKTLRLPKLEVVEALVTATPKRVFSGDIHKFNIHSLCPSSDGETFLSADNLCINQWSLYRTDVSYNIVNIKPADIQTLTEVITSADLDASNHNMFMYATNRGVVRLGDLREKALNDVPSRLFADPALETLEKKGSASSTPAANRPFLNDMLRSISDVKFSQGGRFIVARDYMNIKVWDVAMEKRPLDIIPVHDYLQPKLWDLYENESIFDCFDVAVSAQGELLTGSYGNLFHVYDLNAKSDTMVEASKPPVTVPITHAQGGAAGGRDSQRKDTKKKRLSRPGIVSLLGGGRKKKSSETKGGPVEVDPQTLSYDKRIMQLAFHPDCNAVAVAGENNLFIYAR